MRRGFTLVELISSIAILALITVTLVVTIPNFVNWARETADRQTLTVLNDALNRYKTQGGDVNALTTGTPIAHVISKLQTAVTWSGKGHEFLSGGRTFVGRSIDALGDHHQYRFTRYDHYEAEVGGTSPVASSYPYGEGVGYMSVIDGNGIWMTATSSTGYWALKVGSSTPLIFASNQWAEGVTGTSATFWACVGAVDDTASGYLTILELNECSNGPSGNCYNNVSAIDVGGLNGLITLNCGNNKLTSLDVSGLSTLEALFCDSNLLTSLSVSDLPNLQSIGCDYNTIQTLNLFSLPNLTNLSCGGNQLSSLDVTSFSNLQLLNCRSSQLQSLSLSGLQFLTQLDCMENQLMTLDLSGLSDLQVAYCADNQLGPINTAGCSSLPAPSTNTMTYFQIQNNPSVTVTGQWTYP